MTRVPFLIFFGARWGSLPFLMRRFTLVVRLTFTFDVAVAGFPAVNSPAVGAARIAEVVPPAVTTVTCFGSPDPRAHIPVSL